MTKLLELIRLKAFWEAVAFALAGVTGLLYLLGIVDITVVVVPATFLSFVYSVLKIFGITPELLAKATVKAKPKAKKTK